MGTIVLKRGFIKRTTRRIRTYDSSPTPKPEIMRPTTITLKPVVKVCTAPPMENTTAPAKRVPRLPYKSPILPAAIDVTTANHIRYLALLERACERELVEDLPKAPTSSTATMVPISKGPGEPKNLRKWGPVITPDITLSPHRS
jgi:hypothetical protein